MKKDQNNKQINIGDTVLFNNQDSKANFINYEYGVVIGFTKYFVIIKPDDPDCIFGVEDKEHIYRKPHRIIIIENYKTKYLYLAADFENYKKSSIKRIENEVDIKVGKIILNLLEIVDDLNRAIEMNNDSTDIIGIVNIKNKYIKILEKYGVKSIEPQKEELFNPELHEAISIIDLQENMTGKIIDVMQAGYTLNNKLLRPAKVVVGK